MLGASGAGPVFIERHVVDGAQRRMAARRHHPHPVEHGVDPEPGPGRGRPLRRPAHGHHLHRGLGRRFRAEFLRWGCILPIPLFGGVQTVGASAPIFGLLGALVSYGGRGGSSAVMPKPGYALALFVFGLIFPGVDNAAHAGGFVGGICQLWLDPLKPERVNHMLGAVICLRCRCWRSSPRSLRC